MPDSHIDHAVAEDPNKRARALLLRLSLAVLERAEAVLEHKRPSSVPSDHYAPDHVAARLIEVATRGIEVAIGPIDPPDLSGISKGVGDAVASAFAKSPPRVHVYIGDEEIVRAVERKAAPLHSDDDPCRRGG